MPRKILRRWIPTQDTIREYRCLAFLRPLLHDPNLFHLNRHSVSVAFFAGIFCAFLPVPGQSVLAALLALLLRCNMPIAFALVWITNPLTAPPVFFLNFELGRWLLDRPPMAFSIEPSWQWFQDQGEAVLLPLLVGSLASGLVFGAIGYGVTHQLWRWHEERNWEIRKKRRLEAKNGD